ncbi:MAG: LLM class flavin-dependent oxidoreductase [Candidatus Binataceae bacterium]|nr:LLM class flavin-dependent oxidoreductase [Candidatus Binataceae bacterium]
MAQRNPSMFNRNRLKLGLFGPNCSSGEAATKVPERWVTSWENNIKLAQLADEVGIECMVPIGRWKGYGGETNFEGETWETITWAAGLLAHTKKISAFGTVHVPLFHPIVAAKQMVTADHMGQGRFGLNIVCGWNPDEFEMFGVERRDHELRYEYGQEWWDIVRKIWSGEGPFDYQGKYFKLKNVEGSPRPYGGQRPAMMNAGGSETGRQFAIRNADFHFDHFAVPEQGTEKIKETKRLARELGHEIAVFNAGYVVCRPTEKEAKDYEHYFIDENADWAAADHLMEMLVPNMHENFQGEVFSELRRRFVGGYGGLPIIGNPDQVAQMFKRIHDAGLDGIIISFVNYLDELPYFAQEVLPRLERMGIREPVR